MDRFILRFPCEQSEAIIDRGGDVAEQAVLNMAAARLRRSIRTLPTLERLVVCWRYGIELDQLSWRQISSRLGISINAAKEIELRALDLLRQQYGLKDAA